MVKGKWESKERNKTLKFDNITKTSLAINATKTTYMQAKKATTKDKTITN